MEKDGKEGRVWTLSEIADAAGTNIYKVRYYLKTRNVQPIRRIGNVNLYTDIQANQLFDWMRRSPIRGA